MNSLAAKEVTYEYRNAVQTVRAVNGVSCEFRQGLVYAVVGASGSGKTTFLSLLAGLDVPASGSIELDGAPTSQMNRDDYRLKHVSMIYQNFNLFQHLTVLENAAYPLYERRMPRKQADALAASSSVWRSPGRWPPAARSFWPTSQRAIWTVKTAGTSWRSSGSWRMRKTAVSSLSPMIPKWPRRRMWC